MDGAVGLRGDRRAPGPGHARAAIGYPIYLILADPTGIVISSLPLPAGGAGGVEATVAFALHGTGVPRQGALLGVFVHRIITSWLPALPALLLLPSIRRLHETLPRVAHTRPDADEGVSFRPGDASV